MADLVDRDREIERRLATMETLMQTAVEKLGVLETSLTDTADDFKRLKYKGAGILIGVALAAGAIGAKASALLASIFG